MNTLELIAHNTYEFTMIDPLTDRECVVLGELAHEAGVDVAVNKSGRIITVECDDMPDATGLLAELGLVETIGLIRHITEYEPQWDHALIEIEFE